MSAVSIEEAQANLPALVHELNPGEEVVILENSRPIAKIVPTKARSPRKLGTLRGTVLEMAPDFDAPLDDFEEYMR